MNENQQVITRFYTAFKQLDYKTMQGCYHEEAIFFDPVFENLDINELRNMWEMLCKSAGNFSLQFSDVEADAEYGTCKWIANYKFSQTGKSVTNKVKAYFKFHEGKIIEHTDNFDLWKWSRQALGLPGWLLGWNGALQNKIRAKARGNLTRYMQKKS